MIFNNFKLSQLNFIKVRITTIIYVKLNYLCGVLYFNLKKKKKIIIINYNF
jgi:hypothetical protein